MNDDDRQRRLLGRWLRPRPQRGWVDGNTIELLENGEAYYPAVFEAIAQARREVLIETFILFEDKVGIALKDHLVAAARRGVQVDLLVDGWGSPDLSDAFLHELAEAGVRLRAFDQRPRLFGFLRHNLFRRMHRKIVAIDGDMAFVGGINFSADHLGDFGPEAKQDYAVRLRGPIVERIRTFVRAQLRPHLPAPQLHTPERVGEAEVMFVYRDNLHHRDDIERQYRAAIRTARREVIIANAYFFPGYRLLKTIRQAARRGVKVTLILQGQPDMQFVKTAAGMLHTRLLRAGVEVHEYCKRPLHGKVAIVDDEWATVGSSNLDPLSLSLNLESNVITRDRAFVAELRANLRQLVAEHCTQIQPHEVSRARRWFFWLDALAYHVTRHFPAWAGWLPAHRPQLAHWRPAQPPQALPVDGADKNDSIEERACHARRSTAP